MLKTKVLIIRFSSIGDIVLTSPVVRCLKNQLEDVEIHYLTKKRHGDLLKANPYIHHIHLMDHSLDETIRDLKKENFDCIVDLHNNFRSLKVKQALRVKAYSFRKLNIRKLLLTWLKLGRLPKIHIVDRYMDTLKAFHVKNDHEGLDHFIPEKDEIRIDELPEDFRKGYVVLVLAGTYFTKRLPVEKYHLLVEKSQIRFVLLGGKNEIPIADQIMEWATGNVVNFTGKLKINQSASLIRQAQLVISNDTGLMHIAAAFKKNILSVWGNTVPEFGMVPYMPGELSKILEVEGLPCRPCSKLGFKKCPKKHFKCMREIPEAEMVKWVEKVLVR